MNKVKSFLRGCKVFMRGLKVLIGVKPFARGDMKIAMTANLFQRVIAMKGASAVGGVRRLAINTVEDVVKERLKKNPLAEEEYLVKPFLSTPDWMDLMKDLDMGETDLQFFANEALKKWGEK